MTPVLLLHGTNDTGAALRPLGDALAAAGHAVSYVDYGRHRASLRGLVAGGGGLAPLAASTAEVVAALDALTSAGPTGRVDIVGHSQGGLHAFAAARARPGAVRTLVTLEAPLWGARPLGRWSPLLHARGPARALDLLLGPSARGMVPADRADRADDRAGWTPRPIPGVRHLTIVGDDRMLAPPPGADEAGLGVVRLAERHPGRRVRHDHLPADEAVIALVLDALAP